MKASNFARYALGVCAATMLVGCGGVLRQAQDDMRLSPSVGGPSCFDGACAERSRSAQHDITAERTHARPAYSVLFSFKGKSGVFPYAGLLDVNGTLDGTTLIGGAKCSPRGCGTVFAITTSGKETVLHSFASQPDAGDPAAGLLNVNGTLYGTTIAGGANCYTYAGCGAVFAIATSGKETVLYSFGGSGDGKNPYAGLINVKGTLYGTTYYGGANGDGTVFAITTSGTETMLYSFDGKTGANPDAGLINVKGTLYGTTENGGTTYCEGSEYCGTVFAITRSGKETVLHNFGGSGDGTYPEAALINVKGTFYGTTMGGGVNCSASYGCGTVFAITPSGKETVLHSFGGSGDGSYPRAGLINVKGTLYGTTFIGGANGSGTVFSITSSGKETVLHSFAGGTDGAQPLAGLVDFKGTLYGTTSYGGAKCNGSTGCGTVFALTP